MSAVVLLTGVLAARFHKRLLDRLIVGASLAGLRERREDLYREVSRLRLDASRPVAEVVGDVVAWLAVAS